MAQETIVTTAITAVVSILVGYLFSYLKHVTVSKVNEHEDKERVFAQLLENYQKTVERQDKIIERLDALGKRMDSLERQMENVTHGGKVLLRDRIVQSCRVFIERGSIPLHAQINISELYQIYHGVLKGNGMGEHYYKQMMKLPTDDTPLVGSFHLREDTEVRDEND